VKVYIILIARNILRIGTYLSDRSQPKSPGVWRDKSLCNQKLDRGAQGFWGMKQNVLGAKVMQTDDTPVNVLDPSLPRARIGRIGIYVGFG
jgi:hypothetical protein